MDTESESMLAFIESLSQNLQEVQVEFQGKKAYHI